MLVSDGASSRWYRDVIEFASRCAHEAAPYFDTTRGQAIGSHIAKEIGEEKGNFAISLDSDRCLNGVACLADLEFDSAIFKMKMGAIRHLYASGPVAEQAVVMNEIVSRLLIRAGANGFCHLMARTPSSSYQAIHTLEQHSFRTMGVQVTLVMKSGLKEPAYQPQQGTAVRPYAESDLPFLEELSAEAFTESRLFADPCLPVQATRRLHRLWIANDCHGRAAKVFVADLNGTHVGYIACLLHQATGVEEPCIGDIDLLAVSPSARGKGIGSALIAAALQWLRPLSSYVIVRTQVSNYRAIALYQRAGFELAQAHTTLHARLRHV